MDDVEWAKSKAQGRGDNWNFPVNEFVSPRSYLKNDQSEKCFRRKDSLRIWHRAASWRGSKSCHCRADIQRCLGQSIYRPALAGYHHQLSYLCALRARCGKPVPFSPSGLRRRCGKYILLAATSDRCSKSTPSVPTQSRAAGENTKSYLLDTAELSLRTDILYSTPVSG